METVSDESRALPDRVLQVGKDASSLLEEQIAVFEGSKGQPSSDELEAFVVGVRRRYDIAWESVLRSA